MKMDTDRLPFSVDMIPTSWKIATLSDVCSEIADGDWIESKDQGGNDYRLLQISNIGVGTFIETGKYRYVTEETYSILRCKEIVSGQILVARMPDPVGRAWFVKSMPYKAITAVDVAILTPISSILDGKYCSYYLNSPQNLAYAQMRASGTTRLRITRRDLASFPIPIPPLSSQKTIAAILSAYDDLINVNTQRIRILEQIAKSVYREWFGMVGGKSLPEGWETVKIGSAFEIVGGSTPSTKVPEYWEGGDINWYSPTDLTANKAMFIRSSGKKITQEGLKNSSAKVFPPYCVMMTSRATIGVVSINTTTACTNQGFITCIPNDRVSVYQIFYWILDNLELIDKVASGATYKEIGRGEFREFDFIIPNIGTKQKFDKFMVPISRQIEILLVKNANLQWTRDLLLPRLVSGEVEVSEAVIAN